MPAYIGACAVPTGPHIQGRASARDMSPIWAVWEGEPMQNDNIKAFLEKAATVQQYARYVKRKGDGATTAEKSWLNVQYCLLRESWDSVTVDMDMPDQFWDLA